MVMVVMMMRRRRGRGGGEVCSSVWRRIARAPNGLAVCRGCKLGPFDTLGFDITWKELSPHLIESASITSKWLSERPAMSRNSRSKR
jgi:hypothetical protein